MKILAAGPDGPSPPARVRYVPQPVWKGVSSTARKGKERAPGPPRPSCLPCSFSPGERKRWATRVCGTTQTALRSCGRTLHVGTGAYHTGSRHSPARRPGLRGQTRIHSSLTWALCLHAGDQVTFLKFHGKAALPTPFCPWYVVSCLVFSTSWTVGAQRYIRRLEALEFQLFVLAPVPALTERH